MAALAGCSSDSRAVTQASPLNLSPLAHLTYDCAILDGTAKPNAPEALFYLEPYDDGGSGQSRMCALDGDGKFVRQLDRGLAVQQSADGSRLLAVDYPVTGAGPTPYVAVDDRNRVLQRLSSIWNGDAIWADDNRQLCYMEASNPAGPGRPRVSRGSGAWGRCAAGRDRRWDQLLCGTSVEWTGRAKPVRGRTTFAWLQRQCRPCHGAEPRQRDRFSLAFIGWSRAPNPC